MPAKNTIVMLAAALFLGLQAKAGVGHSQVSGTADEIVLERSSGGVGPFYTVSVRKDGRVTWYGQANVRVKGRAHARIEKGAAEKLFEMARAMNFFSAQEVRGRDCIPDSGEVRVTVREMQRDRTISDYCSFIEGLAELANAIDTVTHSTQWIFTDVPTLERLISSGRVKSQRERDIYMLDAINDDNPDIVRVLIKHGFNINAPLPSGHTCLMQAMVYKKLRAAEALLVAGADPTLRDKEYGETPAIDAGFAGAKMVRMFLDRNVPINDSDASGRTMLMNAASSGDLEAVQLIVLAGAKVNARNSRGQTAIGIAEELRDRYRNPRPEKLNAVINYLFQNGGER